jgi:hypothetical protein
MSNPPIIEVYIDEEGTASVKLRPCSNLPAEGYAMILADLAVDVAKMFESESEGKFSQVGILRVISEYFNKEIARPTAPVDGLNVVH